MISLSSEDKPGYWKKSLFLSTWNHAEQLQNPGTLHSSTATAVMWVKPGLVYLFLHYMPHA